MLHVWGTGEVPAEFWWRDLRERDQFEAVGMYGRIILKRVFRKWDE